MCGRDKDQKKTRGENWFGPTIDPGEMGYLTDCLYSLNAHTNLLTWVELKAWIDMTGTQLNPFECDTLIKMSGAWYREINSHYDGAKPIPKECGEYLEW